MDRRDQSLALGTGPGDTKTLQIINKIADVLELDKYYEMPSDKMVIDPKTATVEEMDKLAEQLRIERIALGHDGNL